MECSNFCNRCNRHFNKLLFYFLVLTMSASAAAKAAGLTGLNDVIEMTKQSRQTLQNWHNDKPELFRVVIAGCSALQQKDIHKQEKET